MRHYRQQTSPLENNIKTLTSETTFVVCAVYRYFDIVENIVTPRAYHTIFLQKLVQNCGCGSLERTDSSGILNEVISSIDNSQMKLIWDVNPIKSTYLTMIRKTTDERINLRDALFRDHTANCQKEITAATKNVLQNPPVQNSCNFIGDVSQEPRKGKLTVLNHCSVISIEFDDLFHDELIETDTKTDSSIGGETGQGANYKKRQPKSSQEKLIAVGVKYFDQKSGINSQKLIRPSGGGEIILCAGAFESPRILLSSGLGGQTNVAASVNIQSSLPQTRPINLRGIGRNLQDHTMLPILCLGNWWTAASQVSLLKEQLTHTTGRDGGPLTTDPKTKSNVSKVVVFGIVGTVLSCVSAAYLCGGNYAEKVILESLSPLYLSLRRHIPTIVKDHASAFLHKANSVPVLSSIVLLVASLCVLSWSFSKDRPHGCDNFPLNRVHGYVLVDADGNVISKDSTEPPR